MVYNPIDRWFFQHGGSIAKVYLSRSWVTDPAQRLELLEVAMRHLSVIERRKENFPSFKSIKGPTDSVCDAIMVLSFNG